jgi:hypothetical protein
VATTDVWQAALESHVGETEDPVHSNCCPVCHEYGPIGSSTCYAWCCATQDLALEAAFGERLLKTAAVGQAMQNAIDGLRGLSWVPLEDVQSGATPITTGDLPCFDWGGQRNWNDMHIEGVVNPYTQLRFQDIGGNVQDACDYHWRSLNSSVMGFIRPPFDLIVPVPPPAPPPVQEDTMDFMYVRRNVAGKLNPVFAVLDSGEVYVVVTFRSFEGQRKLFTGSHNVTPQTGAVSDVQDTNGDIRKVVLTDEVGAQYVYKLPAAT